MEEKYWNPQKSKMTTVINISGIPAGVYFINLKSGNLKSFSQKLIIK